jgi:hypothetical protein
VSLSTFEDSIADLTDFDGALKVTAEVQPAFINPLTRERPSARTPRSSVAKLHKRLAGKAPKSERESTVRKQKAVFGKKLSM